jgi:uncharacterized membrane-anchored protein
MAIVFSTLNHPLRVPLAAEIHSRPPIRLEAPEVITHLAVHGRNEPLAAGDRLGMQSALLADFCARFGVPAPAGNAKYFFHDFGRFRLKWECHTEFASFTVVTAIASPLASADPFARMPSSELPEDWLLSLKGRLIVATHIVLDHATASAEDLAPQMRQLFDTNAIVGCGASQAAQVWTDFRIHADGFARFVVLDAGLKSLQAGRLVQRLLEIETYRVMALLGLPVAQQAAPVLNDIAAELASVTREMARIHELRELRVEGVPTIEEFMQRRLTPAMNTCTATSHRQEVLAERIANTNSLLRTRVGIRQERQNSQILESMNTRAAQQLRLQQAVEGLSVAAISYYLVGLLGYLLKGAKAAGLPVNTDLATGIAVPVLAVMVWMGLRALRAKFQSPVR